jgi:hypothetical protein
MAKKKGETYRCQDCGLVVVVDEACECEPTCELMCCGKPMKKQKK